MIYSSIILFLLAFISIIICNGGHRPVYHPGNNGPAYKPYKNNNPVYRPDYRPSYNPKLNHMGPFNPNVIIRPNYNGMNINSCYNFNSAFSMCCNGILQEKRGLRPACCGPYSYDSTFSRCCNGRIRSGLFC